MNTAPYPAWALYVDPLNGMRPVVFTLPRKCASNTLKHAIWQMMGGTGDPRLKYVGIGDIRRLDDPLLVGVCRNPADRVVSCWQDKIMTRWMPSLEAHGMKPKMPFRDFLKIVCETPDVHANRHFRSVSDEVVIDGELPHHLLRFESLDQDWMSLEEECDWPHVSLEHRNRTTPMHQLTPAEILLIKERYAADYEVFQYA